MKKTWFSFLLYILIMAIIKPFNSNYEFTSIIIVLLHSITMIIIFMMYKNNQLKTILILAFLLRLLLVFWDIYANNIFILPNAGTDDIGFYESAYLISQDLSLLNISIYGGLYSKLLGLLFFFTGPSRVLGGYINVLLGMSVIGMTLKTLKLINIPKMIIFFSIFILSFFPNSLIMSAVFRRETVITFLVSISIYHFIKWFVNAKNHDFFLSIIAILIGSVFHSGIIGIIIGYVFAYVFYHHSTKKLKFSSNTIIYFVVVSSILILGYIAYGDFIFGKFGEIDGVEDIIYASNLGSGGAEYLRNLTITNPLELIIYTPIKMIYFLFSPMPWDWRGFGDIITFIFDSSFYLLCISYYLKYRKYFKNRKQLISILVISLLITTIIFGVGVGNAGTAMRHRQKIVPLFVTLLALMINEKKNYYLLKNKKIKAQEINAL